MTLSLPRKLLALTLAPPVPVELVPYLALNRRPCSTPYGPPKAVSLHEMEADARADPASTQQAGVHVHAAANADEEGKDSFAVATAAHAGAWDARGVQLDLAGHDNGQSRRQEEDIDMEHSEEAGLLGEHHARELIGLSVFGVFKLVSFLCFFRCLGGGAGYW